jgi:hypothetical protein
MVVGSYRVSPSWKMIIVMSLPITRERCSCGRETNVRRVKQVQKYAYLLLVERVVGEIRADVKHHIKAVEMGEDGVGALCVP